MADYEPLHVSDTLAGIKSSGKEFSNRFHVRNLVKKKIFEGFHRMAVTVHIYKTGGQHVDLLTLFKVPFSYQRDSKHELQFVTAIESCRERAPRFLSLHEGRIVKDILTTYTGVTGSEADAIAQIITGDSRATPNQNRVQEIKELVTSGGTDPALVKDMRDLNSRGGKGCGSTDFDAFWKISRRILHKNAVCQERRRSDTTDTLHASAVSSIPDLVKQAKKLLKQAVTDGDHEKMPAIPSEEFIRLQFVPNSRVAALAQSFHGLLDVVRKVQSRTLQMEHEDQHLDRMIRQRYPWGIRLL